MAEFSNAQKIGGLHQRLVAHAEGFDLLLAHLFGETSINEVSDEVKLAGRDGEVIALRITARRLPADEAAAVIAARGAIGS